MKIYVDADASPVKNIVIEEAAKAEIPVILVTSFSHYSPEEQPEGVETIYVDTGAEAADYRIMKMAEKGDIIITQDYGLASLGLLTIYDLWNKRLLKIKSWMNRFVCKTFKHCKVISL